MSSRDSLYATHLDTVGNFVFDEAVASVFPDMIQRSVPGYQTVIAMTGILASRYAREQSFCYDLGCSLGESTFSMRHRITVPECRIIAVDNSVDMLDQCKKLLEADRASTPVDLVCGDIQDITPVDASMVVMNYTLQFIPPEQRPDLLAKIYDHLLPGGILLLSEKICYEDPETDQRMMELHHEFKKANGYSELEISQKRSALENVLIPETLSCHETRLQQAGFKVMDVWFQCFNFISLVAVK